MAPLFLFSLLRDLIAKLNYSETTVTPSWPPYVVSWPPAGGEVCFVIPKFEAISQGAEPDFPRDARAWDKISVKFQLRRESGGQKADTDTTAPFEANEGSEDSEQEHTSMLSRAGV